MKGGLAFSKVIGIEDFSDPELIEVIRDVFRHEISQGPPGHPEDVLDRKQWEVAMSVRALRHFGALRPDAMMLGVAAGTEVTSFYLANNVGQVFATDLYLNAGVWSDYAPYAMLVEPEAFAPYAFDRKRLVVQHMDGRLLEYPDNFFDGIFSSGSIEHFGSLEFIANAAYEMGRVLKPGGVLALSTEFNISGPPDGDGWGPDTFILSSDRIKRYIIEASGLELVDPLRTSISEETMLSKRDLLTFLENTEGGAKVEKYPNVILVHEGYVFTSVHLTLRKTSGYLVGKNAWAKPSISTVTVVEEAKLALSTPKSPVGARPAASLGTPASSGAASAAGITQIHDVQGPQHLVGPLAEWEAVYNRGGGWLHPRPPVSCASYCALISVFACWGEPGLPSTRSIAGR